MLTARQRELWRVNRFLWLALVFLLFWLAASAREYDAPTRRGLLLVFAAAWIMVGLRSVIGFRKGTTGRWGWAFSIVDIGLISAAVRLTGGLHSELWLLYFLLVVTETLSVTTKEEALLTGLTFAGYLAAVWPVENWVTLATRFFFLYVVSAIARRLYLNAEMRNKQLADARAQLGLAEEKSRVARELHDGLGREMVNVILGLEVAKRTLEKKPHQVAVLLDENLALLRGAMSDTRDLIFQTRPWTLDDAGCATLGDHIERYARQFADRTGLTVQTACDFGDAALSPQVSFGVLRVVQEALNNIAKHAQAKIVHVYLGREGTMLIASVADDGIGFAHNRNERGGIGLHAMQERAAELGGTVEIASEPGRGTTVTLRLPL